MKILLISANTAKMPYPVYPLGLSIVAAAAREAGHQVQYFDFLQSDMSFSALEKTIEKESPDVIGISIRNIDNVNILREECYLEKVRRIVELLREISNAKIVLGGSAFSIMPEPILKTVGGDYGICGEGEQVFVRFLNEAEKGNYPPTGTILSGDDYLGGDAMPSPYYEKDLLARYLESGSVTPVQTKRGCPHNCLYCSYPALEGHKLRPRDPVQVVDDIEALQNEHEVSYVFFTDSVFNDSKGLFLEVVREMKKRGIRIPWSAFFNPANITPENVAEMKETGLRAAEVGSDAACDETLKGQRKPFTWADVIRANDIFRDGGVSTAHYFMFGGPGETRETVKKGIENIKNLDCSAVFVFLGIRILPRTELKEVAIRESLVSADNELLEPVYYFSPALDRDWLEKTLNEAFEPLRYVVYPPNAMDDKLQMLHKLGHTGALWDLLSALPEN
ncbi:MAG: lipid biosynthesis B12-binding/radical SAM protein [Candidatus Brocadiia bacterium]